MGSEKGRGRGRERWGGGGAGGLRSGAPGARGARNGGKEEEGIVIDAADFDSEAEEVLVEGPAEAEQV